MPPPRVVGADRIRAAVSRAAALAAVERAFRVLAEGDAVQPPPMGLDLPAARGEVHVKGAYLAGAPIFAVKVASGFYGNPDKGLPVGSGLVLVFDAETGVPLALLADGGYLTELRTAAAGALAVRELTPNRPLVAAVVGAGTQARFQLPAIAEVRELVEVRAWSRRPEAAAAYAREMEEALGVPCAARSDPASAVRGADLVVTVTPSREPLLRDEWLERHATVVAVGSDGPGKRELESRTVARARVVTDLTAQCARLGELQHALREGLMTTGDVHAELGEIVVGRREGRQGDELVVCDLTGVGAQDAAMAEAAWAALGGEPGPRPARDQRPGEASPP